jgi:tetratricopeptide (TPR) repeat protein
MTVIKFPVRYDVRISHQRRRFRSSCTVIQMPSKPAPTGARTAYDLYCQASEIDETEPDRAISMYQKATALDPSLAIAYTNEGNCHFRLHNPTEAERLYRKALELDANQPEALYNLGYLTLERGQSDDAIPLLRAAVTADRRFADAWFNLAMALEQSGKPAQLEWQRYISLEPKGHWTEIARRHLA